MVGYFPLKATCRRTLNHITERATVGYAPKATSTPSPKVVLHTSLNWLSKQSPRLPTRPWHNIDARVLLFGILGSVAAAQRFNDAHNLTTFLKARLNERFVHQVRHNRRSRYKDVRPWHNHVVQKPGELREEQANLVPVGLSKSGEPWHWLPCRSIKFRWNAPHPAMTIAAFGKLVGSVLQHTKWRIRHDCMNRVAFGIPQPIKCVHLVNGVWLGG